MDCIKVGQLIATLRKEKGLTQQQVAQQLNISNKTVSKWECGLGCPDLTVWDALSTVLEADIRGLLKGELTPNPVDVGRIDHLRFYVCPSCGNILTSTGAASIACCGRGVQPLTLEENTEGCEITVEEIDMEYYVTFDHPMEKGHYISFVAYVLLDRVMLVRLYPEQGAQVYLPMLRGVGKLYLHCTNHGLQRYALRKDSHLGGA